MTEAVPSAGVVPDDTEGPLNMAVAALVAAVGQVLDGDSPKPENLATLREIYTLVIARQKDHFRAPHAQTDLLIHRFAQAVRLKLARAEAKHGWHNAWAKTDWEPECRSDLARHLLKGDPLDVAAYSAFCWHHGWSTSPMIPDVETPSPWTNVRAFEVGFTWAGMVCDHLAGHGTSRDVGRTLTSPIFAGLPMDLDVIPNHAAADHGVVLAKREIARALASLEPAG